MASIPSVSLAAFLDGTADEQQAIAADVDRICRHTGFLIVEQHGVPADVIETAWSMSQEFFDLPLAEKLVAQSPDPGCPRGYFPLAVEALAKSLGVDTPPDVKESFGIGPLRAPKESIAGADLEFHYGANLWPENPPGLRDSLIAYFEEMERLGARLLRLFAAALGLPQDYFEQFHNDPMCALRCINYPALSEAPLPGQKGAGEHSDYGSITVLKSDPRVAGLEVKLPSGEWIAAPLVGDAFIVNIGDMMARWTNDRWVSTLHRVISPRTDTGGTDRRQSMAFFHNTSFDARIECIPTCHDAARPPKYGEVRAGDYLLQRFTSAITLD